MTKVEVVDTDQQVKDIAQSLWDDRITFAKQICKFTPSDQQGDLLTAMDKAGKEDGNKHFSVASGHGCGKDGAGAVCIIHYNSCRPFPKIPCTAPSKHQLYDVLWAEISKWHRQMNPIFKNMLRWTKESFYHVDHPEEWFAVARTATKERPEALQGFHADYVFRVIDEASGVPEPIFEVADGATGRVETVELLIANPTKLEGTFYRSHHQDRDEYTCFEWSCLQSNIAPPAFARRMERKFGVDSNIYRVRVLGKFPLRVGDSFIPFHWAEAAVNREIIDQSDQPIVIGVDPARFGDDDTCICIRQGDDVRPIISLHNKSTMEVANYVADLANKLKPRMIFTDVIGIGAGVHDRLEEYGFPVMGVNVSEAPAYRPTTYRRLRDELWGNARDWFEARRGRIRDNGDMDFLGEITTPRYKIDSRGRIVIESKDDMKKRGLSSPNKADSFNLTHAQPMADFRVDDDLDVDYYGGRSQPDIVDPEAGY